MAFTVGAAGSSSHVADRSIGARCPVVTVPARPVAANAGPGPDGFNYGNGRLRVHLWSNGVLRAGTLPGGGSIATISRDGSIHAKVGWWVRDVAKLSIMGRRLDRAAPPLRSHVPSGYGPADDIGASLGFQPTGLTFPTAGCWHVVGNAGNARLTFVVEVTALQ
ncbi:hypothetical protein [Gaiella sp.]|uniref:hypothetical protein n=1 Tax=Gaiella sp. TaxID=2663207 RepID=UPI0039836386